MANVKFYLFHALTTIFYDRINRFLLIVCMMIPLCAFFSFSNVYSDNRTNGIEAIGIRHQWYEANQGILDDASWMKLLQTTHIKEYDCSLVDLIELIKEGKHGYDVPLTNKSLLMNMVSSLRYPLIIDLCNRLLDENLDFIPLEDGLTIPDSEGLYALSGDILTILIIEALCVLLIICRSVDHIHMNRFVLLERSYSNTKRLYGVYYLCVIGLITVLYGYTIVSLLFLYERVYQGLGASGSFMLWTNSIQTSFTDLTIAQYFILLFIAYYLLFLVSTNLYMVLSTKLNGLFAWILASGLLLILFASLSDTAFSGIIGVLFGSFILYNSYTYFGFGYGLTIAILLIQFIFYYCIGIFWLNHRYQTIR